MTINEKLELLLKSATEAAQGISAVVEPQQITFDELDKLLDPYLAPIKEQLDIIDGCYAKLHLRMLYADADARARRSELKVIGK